MPVMSFPEGNEEEVSKQLLATLMCSPAMVCFDNLVDGTTFRSGSIAAALTGPQFSKRILGESRVATFPTNVLFMLTGNNISLGADEVTRWLTVYLSPATDRPDLRTFQHPDVMAHARGMREWVLRDAMGLVAGYLKSGTRIDGGSRFPQWDGMVRQPLLWAGGADMAEVFSVNTEEAEESQAYRGLLILLHEVFRESSFSIADVISRVTLAPRHYGSFDQDGLSMTDVESSVQDRGRAIFGALRARDPANPQSVGRVLGAAVGRPVDLPPVGLAKLSRRMLNGYRVFRVDRI